MPRNTDPKIAVSTGVSPEMLVAAESFATSKGIMRGEKPNISGLLTLALAEYINFPLPAEEKAAVSAQTAEQKKEAARLAEQKRRAEARARVEALRSGNKPAATPQPTPALAGSKS